jgi:hypothetical protein
VVGRDLKLRLPADASAEVVAEAIRFGIVQSLKSNPGLRSQALEFVVEGSPTSPPAALGEMLKRAWNGMRMLPFTPDDIACSFGQIALLQALGFGDVDYNSQRKFLDLRFGSSIRVEFGPEDGSSTQAWVSLAGIKRCLRDDIGTLLSDAHKHRADDMVELLQVSNSPQLLFEFEPFKQLFACELIPMQVLSGRSFVCFNPSVVSAFGNA